MFVSSCKATRSTKQAANRQVPIDSPGRFRGNVGAVFEVRVVARRAGSYILIHCHFRCPDDQRPLLRRNSFLYYQATIVIVVWQFCILQTLRRYRATTNARSNRQPSMQ